MALTDQKKRFLKAKIAVALQNEPGIVHIEVEINNVFLLSRVMYKAVLGLHLTRQREPEEENAEDQKQQISIPQRKSPLPRHFTTIKPTPLRISARHSISHELRYTDMSR
jgi:hypothetical protein